VTRWGLVLLLIFLTLGLGSSEQGRAIRYAITAVVVVLLFVSVRNHSL
jgi:hypothetical protein